MAVTVVSTAVAALVEGMAAVVTFADREMAAEKVAAEETAEVTVAAAMAEVMVAKGDGRRTYGEGSLIIVCV